MLALVGACVLVAGVSVVVLPTAMGFDPWAWLVWGREVGRLELDTTGGPSWKPLPAVVTSLLAPAGDLAPDLWLVIARASGLLLACGVFRLAARWVGPRLGAGPAVLGGTVAVGALLLTPDAEPRLLRTILEGHTAPLAAALAAWAIDRFLAGRVVVALTLGALVALLRPEAWPLVAVAAAWLWPRSVASRRIAVVALVLVPLAWFGGDWWGSGDPFHGAAEAQVASGDAIDRLQDASRAVAQMVVVPVWALALVAVVHAVRCRRPSLVVCAAGAATWCTSVVAMSVLFGYAAISRFLLPAAAVVCALGGAAAGQLVRLLWAERAGGRGASTNRVGLAGLGGRVVAVAVLVAVALPFVTARAASLEDVVDEVEARRRLDEDLPAAVDRAGGPSAVLACGPVAVDGSSLLRPALAWELDVPLDRVGADVLDTGVSFVVAGGEEDVELAATGRAVLVTRSPDWVVYDVGC